MRISCPCIYSPEQPAFFSLLSPDMPAPHLADIDKPEAVRDFLAAALMPRKRRTPITPVTPATPAAAKPTAFDRPSQPSQPSQTNPVTSQPEHRNQETPVNLRENAVNIQHSGASPTLTKPNQQTPNYAQTHASFGLMDSQDDNRTKLYAPDLTIFRQPRPDKKWPGSVRSFSNLTSPPGSQYDDHHNAHVPSGIWATAAPAPANGNQKATNGTNQDFNCDAPNPMTWDESEYPDLDDGSFVQTIIRQWRTKVTPIPPSTFLEEDVPAHWLSDVNTEDGRLLPPVHYPETMPCVVDKKSGLDWRRQTWTSALLAGQKAELDERKQRITGLSIHHCDEIPENKQSEWEQAEAPKRDEFGRLIKRKKDPGPPPPNTLSPRLPCYLRPAQESDMEQVAVIYNWEVTDGMQARDSECLPTAAWIEIFHQSQKLGIPFLVAVYGSVRQPGRVQQENDVLTHCTRDPASTVSPNRKFVGKILGFSYLSVWKPGVLGDPNGSSRATAQVNLFVHPDHKRKRVGASLLDKIMTTIGPRYSSTDTYDFIDPSLNPMYKMYREHKEDLRRFHKVYASFFVKSKTSDPYDEKKKKEEESYEDDLQWVEKLLVEQFRFEKVMRFEMVHRTTKWRPGPVHWMDEVVFEYACMWGFDPLGDERY